MKSWREFESYPIISHTVTGSLTYGSTQITKTTYNKSNVLHHYFKMPFRKILIQPMLYGLLLLGSWLIPFFALGVGLLVEHIGWAQPGERMYVFIIGFFIEFLVVLRYLIQDLMQKQALEERGICTGVIIKPCSFFLCKLTGG